MSSFSVRQETLYREFRVAVGRTSAEDLKAWSRASAARLPAIAARRFRNVGKLAGKVAKATMNEVSSALGAWRSRKLGKHLGDRAAAGIDSSIAAAGQITGALTSIGRALFNDPAKNAPDVFALALGFYAGSGGLDGNGGIPDSDLALGIGWHRSVFTHSIIAGTVVEGAILGLADLADVVCDKLPPSERDPFWDHLVKFKGRIAQQLAAGASAGIAYHLAVDGTVQPAPYHDWPFSMSIEEHQAIMVANAVAEGVDAAHKGETTGRRAVHAAARAGRYAVDVGLGVWATIKARRGAKT